MKSKRSARQRLLDILDAIEKGRSLATGFAPEEFSRSWVHRSATERMVEIISEASRHLPPELKGRFPAIPMLAELPDDN